MIHYKRFIVLHILLFSIAGQLYADSTVINGKIKHSVTRQVAILKQDCRYFKETIQYGSIDEKGNFNLKFDIEQPGYYYFRLGELLQPLYLQPGDSIKVLCNLKYGLNSLQISGSNQSIQEYLIEFNIGAQTEYDNNHKLRFEILDDYRGLSQDKIMDKIDSITESRYKRLKSSSKKLPESFIELEFQRLKFSAYIAKMHVVESLFINSHSKKDIDERFYILDKSNAINYSYKNDELTQIPEYLHAAFEMFRSIKEEQSPQNLKLDPARKAALDFQISKSFASGLTLHYLRNYIIKDILTSFKTQEEAAPYLQLYINSDAPQFLKREIHEEFTSHYNPDPSHYFSEIKMLDENKRLRSLDEFKGQFLVIVFYTKLIGFNPYLDHLQTKYFDRHKGQLAYVAINIDSKIETWLSPKEKFKFTGENWWGPKDLSDFFKRFKARRAYQILIVDRNGDMIFHDNHKLKFNTYDDTFKYIQSEIENQ